MKKSKNNNIILGFSFTYLVLVYPMDSKSLTKIAMFTKKSAVLVF